MNITNTKFSLIKENNKNVLLYKGTELATNIVSYFTLTENEIIYLDHNNTMYYVSFYIVKVLLTRITDFTILKEHIIIKQNNDLFVFNKKGIKMDKIEGYHTHYITEVLTNDLYIVENTNKHLSIFSTKKDKTLIPFSYTKIVKISSYLYKLYNISSRIQFYNSNTKKLSSEFYNSKKSNFRFNRCFVKPYKSANYYIINEEFDRVTNITHSDIYSDGFLTEDRAITYEPSYFMYSVIDNNGNYVQRHNVKSILLTDKYYCMNNNEVVCSIPHIKHTKNEIVINSSIDKNLGNSKINNLDIIDNILC